ncbi:hypothetical protein BASA50_003365 [Batrachochytrium salamandrivorans]|uniref:Uncharacterized protein n=1 Tax=Batrachochytrium salamandrivorans TaxID=1357716 RepID=A0ABQ8FLD1_9FUNG|nr:hypothetical protein BASA50_003365 [Batrachochytrium salamandrivorans]
MKLQGVFMIMPLLAAAASGSTIPSTDSYNVQQLEKRGDNDPASKEFTDEGSNGQTGSSSFSGSPHMPQDTFGKWDDESDDESSGDLRLGAEFKGSFNQEGGDKPEEPSFFSRFGQRIQDFFKKDKPKTNGQEELDNALKENRDKQNKVAEDMLKAVKESNQRHSKKHGKKPSKGASNEKHPETQDIVAGGEEKKPEELSNDLDEPRTPQGNFGGWDDESDGSSSSSENLYMPQGNFGGWDDESEESFDAFQRNRGKQDKHDDILKAIDDLRLRRLKRKQDEEANKGASNENLSETQAQEVVQPSAEPEQTNDDDERNDGRHEEKMLVEKSPTKFPKGPWKYSSL